MEKNSKPNFVKKRKRKQPLRKFKCELCEKIVMKPKEIKTRKNYTHGKKSKARVSYIHRKDGGCLIELKREQKQNGKTHFR